MSKWKCEICGKEFDNFQAQGFDNKVYCPLCFFKEKTNRLEKIRTQLKEDLKNEKGKVKSLKIALQKRAEERDVYSIKSFLYKEVIEEVRKFVEEMFNNEPANSREYDYYCEKLSQILDKVKEN